MTVDKPHPSSPDTPRAPNASPPIHDGSWLPAPARLSFPVQRIDVWLAHLDAPPSPNEPVFLSTDEQSRASRFHFERDRNRFSRCRSILRRLIFRYLAVPAPSIQFDYSRTGKPFIARPQNPHNLQFNVSHSGGLALIAFTSGHELGADIEAIRNDSDTATLAKRFFSSRECQELESLPRDLRPAGFYACWTRKESFLKATGEGLSFPLSNFSVTTHPDHPARLLEIVGEAGAAKDWTLFDLQPPAGFRATIAAKTGIATKTTGFQLKTFIWEGSV